MIKIGLTGSIGMGKSTTAKMFADEGIPVWDADAAVARLYSINGAGTEAIKQVAPEAIGMAGVDRVHLKALIKRDPAFLATLENIIHPLVSDDRNQFLTENTTAEFVLFDIPLLFENGTNSQMDKVVVVSAPADLQKQRVLSRGTMDEDTFNIILSKQMPDKVKRERADFVIETTSIEHARKQVQNILNDLRGQ